MNNGVSGRRVVIGIMSVLSVIALIAAIYFTFFYVRECRNYECFQESMRRCLGARYVNEQPEASWSYKIAGLKGKQCAVSVELLQVKKGELGLENLAGYDMVCFYPKGESAYPEKNLATCHGRLKEELQNVIIKKLHSYIVENLGKFDEALNKAV